MSIFKIHSKICKMLNELCQSVEKDISINSLCLFFINWCRNKASHQLSKAPTPSLLFLFFLLSEDWSFVLNDFHYPLSPLWCVWPHPMIFNLIGKYAFSLHALLWKCVYQLTAVKNWQDNFLIILLIVNSYCDQILDNLAKLFQNTHWFKLTRRCNLI